ncbi:hypothetical protein JCM10003_2989 [Bacteroides pyogenes JCM 10003]|nr:hypothetical protein JCM10003_2989 [Bacteroides pyogenes JCM 10003]
MFLIYAANIRFLFEIYAIKHIKSLFILVFSCYRGSNITDITFLLQFFPVYFPDVLLCPYDKIL